MLMNPLLCYSIVSLHPIVSKYLIRKVLLQLYSLLYWIIICFLYCRIEFEQIMQGIKTMCLSFFFNIRFLVFVDSRQSSQITHTVWEKSCRFMSCIRQTWDLVAALCVWFPSQWPLKAWRSRFFFLSKVHYIITGLLQKLIKAPCGVFLYTNTVIFTPLKHCISEA